MAAREYCDHVSAAGYQRRDACPNRKVTWPVATWEQGSFATVFLAFAKSLFSSRTRIQGFHMAPRGLFR
jgi:hypothetical protein